MDTGTAATETRLTRDAVEFIVGVGFDDISAEALRIGRRCVLDGLAPGSR